MPTITDLLNIDSFDTNNEQDYLCDECDEEADAEAEKADEARGDRE